MSYLRVIRLRIPGQWADGWLYKENIVLWSRTGEMYAVPFKALDVALRDHASPSQAAAASHLILRSDWKVSEQFRMLSAIGDVRRALFRDFPTAEEGLTVNLDQLSPGPVDSEPLPGAILDSTIYANRVYVGTTDGLFETYFEPDRPMNGNAVLRRLHHRTCAVNAGYSVINSSTESNGLWFAPIRISESGWDGSDSTSDFTRIAEHSRSNSFASRNLLNYIDGSFPTFLRAHAVRERPHAQAEYDAWRVVGYESQAEIGGLALAVLRRSNKVKLSEVSTDDSAESGHDVKVLGNSSYRLLVDWAGALHVVNVAAFDRKEIEARPNRQFKDNIAASVAPESILESYAVSSGFVVELWDKLCLITARGSYPLFNERAVRVRTFVASRRHKDAVLVVEEDAVSLVGFLEVDDLD